MIEIKHFKNYYFIEIFGRLYRQLSILPFSYSQTFEKELKSLIDLLYKNFKYDYIFYPFNNTFFGTLAPTNISTNNKTDILIAFSGGKDSLAAVIRAKENNLNPILFYVKNINKAYPSEMYYVGKLHQKLINLNIVKNDWVAYTGELHKKKSDRPKCKKNKHVVNYWDKNNPALRENPVKNQYILSLMIQYGIDNGINKFSFGNHSDESLNKPSNIYFNFSDYIEVFNEVEKYYKNFYGDLFEIKPYIKNDTNSACEILKTNYKLYLDVSSCMAPEQMGKKAGYRKANLNKFCKALPDSWCGSCYKCAFTYILFDLLGLVDNINFLDHSWNFLTEKSKDRFPDDPNNPLYNTGKNFTNAILMKLWFDADIIAQFKLDNTALIGEIKKYFNDNDLFK